MPDMTPSPDIAAIAALMGEPTRGRMLTSLMDGRAQTATELALAGGVSASTASSHLSRLTSARLVEIAKQGRHRYYRLASADVARAIESLMSIAPAQRAASVASANVSDDLRRARVCYDHLAGEAGVQLLARLRAAGYVRGKDDAMELTSAGATWCGRIGIDFDSLTATRRRVCRPCLDWTERRTHLGGSLGAALLERLIGLRYARRLRDSRVVALTVQGEHFLEKLELYRR